MRAAVQVMPRAGVGPVLSAMGLSVATFYRQRQGPRLVKPRPKPASALSLAEEASVLDLLHGERFVDKAPAEVVATLLSEGKYTCSERTMYRLLDKHGEVKERRDQLRHPAYNKPELVATEPNEVWSWDITKLKTHAKWTYLYLYVVLDIFSRYVVGWMLAEHENGRHAERLMHETFERQGIKPGQLVLHADRGQPMRSKRLSQLLADLDVTRSHSRPHVSDDNPFSESQFKTLKYHPRFPGRFGGQEDGLAFCREFFPWYNDEHHHSALAYLTPRQVHLGQTNELLRQRHETMLGVYARHPERFVGGPPQLATLARAVYINPPPSAPVNADTHPMSSPAEVTPTAAGTTTSSTGGLVQ
jgi:putative transposase